MLSLTVIQAAAIAYAVWFYRSREPYFLRSSAEKMFARCLGQVSHLLENTIIIRMPMSFWKPMWDQRRSERPTTVNRKDSQTPCDIVSAFFALLPGNFFRLISMMDVTCLEKALEREREREGEATSLMWKFIGHGD